MHTCRTGVQYTHVQQCVNSGTTSRQYTHVIHMQLYTHVVMLRVGVAEKLELYVFLKCIGDQN